jgi:octaprenyl-diphosphate synthase
VLEAHSLLTHYAQECCRGQAQELLPHEGDPEEAYLAIVRGKTAAPFAAAATVGALLGGGSPAVVKVLERYGANVGIAFQIHDDLLDFIGEARTLGKPVGQSLTQGRPLLPLIYLTQYGSAAARAEYARLCRTGLDRRLLTAVLAEEGIFARVQATLGAYLRCAQEALGELPPSDAIEALRKFPAYAVS